MLQQSEFPEELAVEESPREIHFSEYWAVIVKRRRLIFLCIAAALGVAALLTVLSEPLYKAVVIVSVERDRWSPLPINVGPTEQSFTVYDQEFLPTQMRLMKSREIAERVVKRLNLVGNAQPPAKSSGPQSEKDDAPVPAGQAAITRAALGVRGGVEASPVRGTNLVELSYVSPSPRFSADLANAMADAYIEWNLDTKFRLVNQTSQFLITQIEQVKSELDVKEKELLAYGRQKDIISSDPQANVTMRNLEAFNSDYASALAERVGAEARYREALNSRPEALADTVSSGMISSLRNEQAKLERDYAEKLNTFKPEWPAMQQLKTQIEKGRQHLDSMIQGGAAKAREAAKSDYQTALRREQNLKGVTRLQKSEAMVLSTDVVAYNNLRVEVEIKKALLDALAKRHAETEVMSRLRGERLSNVRVVERALPPGSPFKPAPMLNGLLGLLSGTVLGVGLAFFLNYMDRSLRTVEQVEQHLQLPALGVIPAVGGSAARGYGYAYGPKRLRKKKQDGAEEEPAVVELLPHHHPRSRVAERYRVFRTALLLSRAGGVKSLVVTSGFSQEGKTVTAVNLAVVLGQLGKRVLLVDADLHRPRLHEILNVSNRAGLVSILAEDLEPARAIAKTDVPGVFALPSGPSSPNPSGLLSSEAMSNFLKLSRMNFDHVILDTPPVVPVADALVLGHQTDGVVLCVKAGETPREQVARVRDKLLRSNARILGVLLNNLVEDAGEYGERYAFGEGHLGARSGYVEEHPAASAARTI